MGKFITPVAALENFRRVRSSSRCSKRGVSCAAICYESLFTYLFTADAKAGAEAFFNITNDGWYLDTAPYQHFIVNIFRAAETCRPVLRAANNGISAVIDPWGRVLAMRGLNESGVVTAKVAVYPGAPLSVYTSRGEWFIYACLLAASAFLLAVFLV